MLLKSSHQKRPTTKSFVRLAFFVFGLHTLWLFYPITHFTHISYLRTDTIPLNATAYLLSPQTAQFWFSLVRFLKETDPGVAPLTRTRDLTECEFDTATIDEASPGPDVISVTEADIAALTIKHSAYVSALSFFAPRLPVWKNTVGVVMTAGGGYLGTALTSILLLRHSGSKLPVHLFLDSPDEADPYYCNNILPTLDVECILFTSVLGSGNDINHYQYKVLSILFSPFEKVLFLDADAWSIRSPDDLFSTEPFMSNGMITWPDFWLTTISPHFYKIANFTPTSRSKRRSSESGILLYNKRSHAKSLLLATYYNWYGPGIYYPLLSQHAPGEGDKETFAQAALALSQSFYDVRTPVTVLGRWINDTFETSGMKQADPVSDYYLQAQDLDTDHAMEPTNEKKAKSLFLHHNLCKIDLFKVGDESSCMFRLNQSGNFQRLWGQDQGLNIDSGFDVEKTMWDVIIKAICSNDFVMNEHCRGLKRWYEAVLHSIHAH